MFRRTLLSLTAGLFIFTNVIAGYAFHNGNSGALTTQADSQSGSANFGVPIDVPPGRAGIQPNIQLQYSSSLPNGLLGVGWPLELGSIQRSAKKGVPSYTASDTFVLVQSGSGQELVFDAAVGFYRAKTEGAFMKTEFVNNSYWRVTDKKGTCYYFGEDQASREYDPANTARVFKWALNRVEDLNGNTMTITYWRDGNRLYPQYIDYTSNPSTGLAGFARVEFVWVPRADPVTGYTTGFNVQMNYRLERIDARAGNDLQYRFVLNYHQSNATGRSVLEKITQYGADGTSTLPPLTFQYQEYVNEPAPTYSFVSAGILSTSIGRFFGDFNGDGRMDKALYYSDSGDIQVALSTGSSFQSPSLWLSNFPGGSKVLVGNFDSDGITDLCAFNSTTGNWNVYASNGQNQFLSKGQWLSGFGAQKEPGTGDFNGDGLTDIVYFYDAPDGSFRAAIALNTGTNFTAVTGATPVISNSNATGITGDFNGDGLTDLGLWYQGGGLWEIKLNTGDITAPFQSMFYATGFGGGKSSVIADFNYDGLTDIGYFDNTTTKIVYRLSTGSSFGPEQSTAFNLSTGAPSAVISTADVNGDGLMDFITRDSFNDMDIDYSNGVFPDLLASSHNGVGGTTTISYAPSTTFNNPQLPFPLQLVKSAGQSNNLGDVYTTRYDYAQGLWDGVAREFRGFGSVKVTDPDGNYAESTFLQDDIFKGRVSEQRAYDSALRLFSKTANTWDSRSISPGVNFVYLKRQDGYVYDGDSTGRRTAQEFYYDEAPQAGNLTKTVQLGEVDLVTGLDIPGDSRSVETSYVSNTGSWILGLPNQTTVKDTSGQIVRQSWFYYDNQGNTTVPIKGFLTKKEDWAGTGNVNPVTLYSYDAIGNLSTTTDPKGNITRVTYDTAYNMFPLTTENALAHKVINEYFGVNGVPLTGSDGLSGLWGQVRSTTDPNQKQGRRGYDIFGRLAISISPVDSVTYPTQTTAIQYFSDYTKVTSRQRVKSGQAQTIDAVSFYDGLGRLIQTKTPTEVVGQFAVNGQAEYNSRGLKIKQYLSYFSTSLLDTIVPVDPARARSTIEYDAMGRPVKTINADGTYASAAYDDWMTTATDENGHKQASYSDAWGRLSKKEEYTGADGRSPNYSASPYTLYATTLYSYDSEGNLLQTKDAYNNTTTITYDVLGRKTAMTDPDMGNWTYQYDLNGNLTKQIDAKGQTLTFTYDALNRLTNKTDGTGGTVNVNYTYDTATVTNAKGRLTQAAYTGGNTQFAYDELGRELQSIKAMNTTNYSVNRGYDALNNLLQIQYPDQKNIYYKYNGAGQIEAVSNDSTILPQSFNWQKDGTSYLVLRTSNINEVRTTNDEGRYLNDERRSTSDEVQTVLSSFASWLERNVLGVGEAEAAPIAPVLNTATAGSAQVSLTWGAVAGVTGYKVKYGTTSGTYATTLDVGNVTSYSATGLTNGKTYYFVVTAYNSTGTSANSNEKSAVPTTQPFATTLEAEAMPTKTTGGATTGGWNIWSNGYIEDTIIFPRSGTYELEVVARGSIAAGVWPNMQLRLDQVSKADITVNTTTWKSFIKQVSVTSGSRRVAVAFTNDYYVAPEDRNLYVDKVIIREITASPPPASVLNTAAAGDKQVTLSWAAATGATGYKIYYGTAPGVYGTPITVGNVTTSTVTGLTNGTTYYFAVSATNTGGESIRSNEKSATPAAPMTENPTLFIKNVDYNASGQMTKVEYGNGDVTTYTYNSLNLRLTRLYTVNSLAQPVQDLNYTYDSAGNILSITDNVNTADQTFKYDELNRLVEAVNPNPGSYGTKAYTYDKIGNIAAKDGKTYFYGGTSGGPHAVTALSDGTAFTYDADGNMVTKTEGGAAGVTTNYKYDSENRLIEVKKGGSIIGQYTYDGDGGRTTKVATVSGTTTTTTFVGALFETSGSRTTKFIFLGGQRVAAVTNSPSIGSTTLYYHADHLGGANVLTDATGFKKELIEYEPFGLESRHEKYGSSEEIAWYYFTGKKTDDESGLIYFGARYYDPKLGRFITADDIIQNPTDPQTLNRYSYTSNNPVNRVDPDGHGWLQKFFKQVSKVFDNVVNWLEKVTNSKWSVDIEVGQTITTESVGKVGETLITQPWQVGIGVVRWAYEPRFQILKNPSYGFFVGSSIADGDNVFINGILNNEQDAFDIAEKANGYKYKSLKVAYNPTDGPLADITETFLQKLFFTSSVDRQLANALAGHKGITLSGHSQGAIIAANALVNLGLRGQRGVVDKVKYYNTQISAPRAYLSAAFAGMNAQHVTYGSRNFDPSNVAGPNFTDPLKFLSGIPGLYLPFGAAHHGIEQ